MIDKKIGFSGTIKVEKSNSSRSLYRFQEEAIKALNKTDNYPVYKGLLVIPTGGGKTYTAVYYLLSRVINKGCKVLWLAHRHELLNQTIQTAIRTSYKNIIKDRDEYRYRIISGMHDKPVNIREDDDFIVASKDSLNRGIEYLERWVKANKDNICLVIDEAHHAVAKSYRNIISLLEKYCKNNLKIIGLTATPTRTNDNEKGLLKKMVFKDDICYSVDLNTLIADGILAEPKFYDRNTNLKINDTLTSKELNGIKNADILPEKIVKEITESAARNNYIVNEYINNRDKYGKTLVFAINVNQAIVLNKLFRNKEIKSDYVVSSIIDMKTRVAVSNEENMKKIKDFREGKIDVLINVNILTEGTDIPNVQTIFLTRPTTSRILFNQMVGRGLRGVKAGGTEKAYIVSFIDEWKSKISWISPKSLPEFGCYIEGTKDRRKYIQNLIEVRLIEQFASDIDKKVKVNEISTDKYETFEVAGAYVFTIDNEDYDVEKSCEIIVFNHLKDAYEEFIEALPYIFNDEFHISLDMKEDELYKKLVPYVMDEYFSGYDLSFGFEESYVKDILLYYQIYEVQPKMIKIDNSRFIHVDKSEIKEPEVKRDEFDFEKMSLSQIKEIDPVYWRKLKNMIFEKYKDENGYYVSATGDYKDRRKINFEIDHIIPLSKGGKTVPENLQLLARWENRQKGDMMPENYLEDLLYSKFYIQDKIEESKELAKKILAEDPDNIFTLNIMAAISGIEEKYTQTLIYANKVLKIDEKNGVALSWKGWAYIKKNNLKEAEKCLEEAVNYIDDFDTYYDLAACKNNMKKKDEELYYLLKALDITENHEDYNNGTELDDETYKDRIINISYRLGRVYFSKRKYTEAKSYFERCVECNEEDDDAINWIGVCYDRLKNREKALEYFELAHKLNKKEKRYIENIERIKE